MPVSEFGPLALDAIREAMIAKGNARSYINKNVGRIKRIFKWGVAKQIVPVEVHQSLVTVDGLKRGKCNAKETKPILPVDDAIVDKTLMHCTKQIRDMIQSWILNAIYSCFLILGSP